MQFIFNYPKKPWRIALAIGLLPIIVVTLCASYSMQFGLIDQCFPLFEGCTSISAACRSVPVIYFFRALMLPCTVLLVIFWLLNAKWLDTQNATTSAQNRLILMCGVVGAVFLVLYVIFLGTDGEVYKFLRRFGVYVFFAGTAIAQLLTALYGGRQRSGGSMRLQRVMVTSMLVLGPLNLIQKALLPNPKRIENVIEWHFGLLLCLYFVSTAYTWYRSESSRIK